MVERILVAGVGNIFLSDDGFGSAVANELLRRGLPADVRVVDYGIRGVHLAFDLGETVETLILVDTIPEATGQPGSLAVIEVDRDDFGDATFDAHAMDPGAVLRSLAAMTEYLPHTLVVGCQPADLGDGIGLSEPVAAAVPVAADNVIELIGGLLAETAARPAVRSEPARSTSASSKERET
jgi:hydrogenase maturation protease